jgi:hypothetical protein
LFVILGMKLVVYVGSVELLGCFDVGCLRVGFILVVANSCCVWVALCLGDSNVGGLGAEPVSFSGMIFFTLHILSEALQICVMDSSGPIAFASRSGDLVTSFVWLILVSSSVA